MSSFMKTWIALPIVFSLTFGLFAAPPKKDLNLGKVLYDTCKNCHGSQGEGNPAIGAPGINGLPAWYVSASIKKYQTGLRGVHPNDPAGLRMRPLSRHLKDDKDIDAVSTYIEHLQPYHNPVTVHGDVERGKTLYMTCLACHGPEGQGNPLLKSPPIKLLPDWYIVGQLKKFRTGMRATSTKDVEGQQMKPMALMLPDEQALSDVAAYIVSLGRDALATSEHH